MTLGVVIAVMSIVAMVVLIYAGMHIGVVLALLSFAGVWLIRGSFGIASDLLALSVADSISEYTFGVIPLFILMGAVVSQANFGRDLFDVTNWVFRNARAGLGISTVVANAGFAAITGVSIASASVFTRIAVPEMLRFGYNPRFAVGIVTSSSVLGMLIPPSVLMILYGLLTDVSIGKLFVAGIVPGLLLAVLFGLAIMLAAFVKPQLIRHSGSLAEHPLGISSAALKLIPVFILIGLVLGGIYGGAFTATEAAAVGAGASLVLAAMLRRLTWRTFWNVLVDTATMTASICLLLIAANLYSRMLTLSGMPGALAEWAQTASVPFFALLFIYVCTLLFMGCILDSASIMLITVPIMAPILAGLGADPVWLGIVVIVAVEIGLITPPLGISAFVVHDSLKESNVSLNDIFRGAFPFVLVMLVFLLLLILFPSLALVLLSDM